MLTHKYRQFITEWQHTTTQLSKSGIAENHPPRTSPSLINIMLIFNQFLT
jgi:hypothetical protein